MRTPLLRALTIATALVAGLAVGAESPVSAQSAGQLLRAGQNHRLGNDERPARGKDGPGLAVDPADPRHVVALDVDLRSGNCEHHVSFDGGRTWASGVLRAPAEFGSAPCTNFNQGGYIRSDGGIAFGSGQTVYAAFDAARTRTAGDSTLVARSTDGGRTFAEARVLLEGGATAEPYFIRPKLGVLRRAAGDRVVVEAWGLTQLGGNGFATQRRRAVTVVSNDSGATWNAPVDAQAADATAREITAPVVGADGTVYVGWRTQNNAVTGFAATADNFNMIARSADGGLTWTKTVVRRLAGTSATNPKLAIDPRDGTLYMVDAEAVVAGDPNIWVHRSTDGGRTWSAAVRVNDDLGRNEQRTPNIAVAPNGRVDVLWHDRRFGYVVLATGTAAPRYGDFFVASSFDGGQSFGANRRVSDRSANLDVGLDRPVGTTGFFPGALVPLGEDEILAAWQDPREGNFDNENQDIYLANVKVGTGLPASSETVPEAQPTGLSVALSRLAYPGGSEMFGALAGTRIVVVNEDDAATALAGGVLARANLGPVLASPAYGLPADVKAEVTRVAPIGAFLIGDEGALSGAVVADLVDAGVPADRITRLAGATRAETARIVADAFVQGEQAGNRVVPRTAVIVDPASPEAAAAGALAAGLRYPVLFTDRSGLPAATAEALRSLGTTATFVIGGPGVVADAVLAQLPAPVRLSGPDLYATSEAVMVTGVSLGLPANVVYVADGEKPIDGALLGTAAARRGGALLLTRRGDPAAAQAVIDAVGLRAAVDRVIVARSLQGGPGYRLVSQDGGLFAFGGARFLGSAGSVKLNRPVVGLASTVGGAGYWLVASDGGVFAFGDAVFKGSTGALRLNRPIVGMAGTPSGRGYWLVASDGGVFAFGDAVFRGSTGSIALNKPIVGMAATATGAGYWLVASDGGVFAFGDAVFKGSTGAVPLTRPVVGMAAQPRGTGYWLVASDGGVFAFGGAPFRGSTGAITLNRPIVGLAPAPAGDGYWLVASDGGVFAVGAPFVGSAGGLGLTQPVVGVAG